MNLLEYPVLPRELSLSKVFTEEKEDILIYNTKTGVKAYPNEDTFEFVKRCRGLLSLKEIISELCALSGDYFSAVQESLSSLMKKMEENGMLQFFPFPLQVPRPEPREVHLYSRIENVSLEVTRSCNLRCKHCYNDSGVRKRNELSFEEIKQLIAQFENTGVLNVMLTGGEPLLHPRLFDIIEYIREHFMSCMLFTNGTLLTEEMVTALKGRVLSVTVSIDGAVPQTHDSFRGVPNSFEKTVRAVKMLKEAGIPVRCSACIHRGNLGEVVDIVRLLEELKVKPDRMRPVSYTGRSEESAVCVSPEEYGNVLEALKQYEKVRKDVKLELPSSLKIKNCGIGRKSIVIRSDGEVAPCPPFPGEVSLGNVRECTLAEIWNDSPFLNVARAVSVLESELCRECVHVSVCRGGCMADYYVKTGNLGCGDPYECAYFRVFDYVPVKVDEESFLSVEGR